MLSRAQSFDSASERWTQGGQVIGLQRSSFNCTPILLRSISRNSLRPAAYAQASPALLSGHYGVR